jgi:aminoglycoside phosphotransferase (APT) family kinase protein
MNAHGLSDWLGGGEVRLRPLAGGSSASVYLAQRGDDQFVLRTTAVPPRPDSVRALEREAKVLRALDRTRVPHPRFRDYCEDPTVIGAPFLLMEYVDGWLGSSAPANIAQDVLHATAFALIDALAELAMVDPVDAGLGEFGRPGNFLERQADRWRKLMDQHRADPAYGDRQLTGFDEIGAWLRDVRPHSQKTSLVHGDASYSNVLFARDAPARVSAIIDWEIATIGDPLLDLGRALYPFPARDGSPGFSLAIDHTGYPAREDLAERYAEKTGLSVEALDYYMVLAMYKLAALIEFNHVKSLREPAGSMSRRIAEFVPKLVSGARELSRSSTLS